MTCPFCFSKHSKLLRMGEPQEVFDRLNIVGGGSRECVCPTCFSLDRERLVYVYLVDYFKVFKRSNLHILHIAPERNIYHFLSKAYLPSYLAGALYGSQYPFVKDFLTIDITGTQFPDDSFDLIICNHVLEHIPEESSALNEIWRILKVGGEAILQVPIAYGMDKTLEDPTITTPSERLRQYGQKDHVRLYGCDYQQRLSNHGFDVGKYSLAEEYPLLGLNKEEILYVARK